MTNPASPSYRIFVYYSTDSDGLPVLSNEPSYFRIPDRPALTSQMVEHWVPAADGGAWERSMLQPFSNHLDDVLSSGATVREVLDDEPGVPR